MLIANYQLKHPMVFAGNNAWSAPMEPIMDLGKIEGMLLVRLNTTAHLTSTSDGDPHLVAGVRIRVLKTTNSDSIVATTLVSQHNNESEDYINLSLQGTFLPRRGESTILVLDLWTRRGTQILLQHNSYENYGVKTHGSWLVEQLAVSDSLITRS